MKTKITKRIFSLILSIVIIFTSTTLLYREAQAEALVIPVLEAGAAAGGLTVGGFLAVSLSLVAAGYGCYLVVDNWEEITTACGEFFQNTTGAVKDWWDSIVNSAIPSDEDTVPLPDKLQTPGEVINFFDYYTPTGGGGEDPGNGDKLELNPQVLGALYSFLITYYGVEALDPDEVFSNNTISAMSIEQLVEYIDYQPAAELLYDAYQKSLEGLNGYQAFEDFGILYALLTPKNPIEMYEDDVPIYIILDVPDLSDTIFVGVKDDGTSVIHAMGYTGTGVSNSNGARDGDYNQYLYPSYSTTGALDKLNEPFMSQLQCLYDAAYFKRYSTYDRWGSSSGEIVVNSEYLLNADDDNLLIENLVNNSNPSSDYYDTPLNAYYTIYVGNTVQQDYYYFWDNVMYNDGNLQMGNYNVNFVGGRDYFNFYQYDYEDWLDNKEIYFNAFRNLTKGKGAIETYVDTTFEKFIPGESYTIPKSQYKVIIPEGDTVNIDINQQLLDELAKINIYTDDNFDRIIEAINEANKNTVVETGETVIDKIIIEINETDPGNIDVSETNALIENLPQNIADTLNVPGALTDAFSPTGDFTSLNSMQNSFTNFFNFDILYQYHEMIETFFTERIDNDEPPVFSIYPKQSGLVYFKDMPNKVDVINFAFMEQEVFTWGITIRYFVRSLLAFLVLGVWLNRTLKKLPGIVSGL